MSQPRTAEPLVQTLEQLRMRYALAVVQQTMADCQNESGEWEKYVSHSRNLPAQVLQNGLNQALAFCLSKQGEKSWLRLGEQVDHWLTGRGKCYTLLALPQSVAVFMPSPHEKRGVLELMLEHDMDTYMLATREALEVLHFIQRFATAFSLQ